jgi:uncharacterized protein YraI
MGRRHLISRLVKGAIPMKHLQRFLLIALVLALAVVPALAQGDEALVRFVHAIPGASAIDVYTDGQLTLANLAFGSASSYIQAEAGSHHLVVTQNGTPNALWEQDIELGGGTATTLVASSAAVAQFQSFQDDLNPLPLGKTRFTAIHAISSEESVDVVLADGRPVIPGLEYNQPYGTLDLPALSYELAVVPAGGALGDALIPAQDFNLNSGTSYLAIVDGTTDAPEVLLLSAPTSPEVGGGYVRIAHTVPGAAAVDVYLNNTLVAPALAFGTATDYIALPAGSYTLAARGVGSEDDIVDGTLDVSADGYLTALLAGSDESPTVQVFEDSLSAVSADTSVFALMNTSESATVSASLDDGTELVGEVAAGASDSAVVEPTEKSIVASVSDDGVTNAKTLDLPGGIYGGVYYGAVAVTGADGADVVQLPSVSLEQSVASAPGAEVVAQPTVAPTEAPTNLPPVEATPTPTVAVEILAQPTAIPTTTGPTARVLLDPGANLQLRQYPSREAFSLGLAPSGSVLRVNGRAGAPIPQVGTTATPIPPEATEFVDPVTLLAEDEDLDPALTWLNVTYDTPDGGTITAWVNALYIGLRDARGLAMRLRDLPTIPENQPGEAQDTAIQPPSPRENITMAIATNVAPGVRIHIRRTPTTEGESLALVSAGTGLEFLGVNELQDWVFVIYATPESTVRGWVSTDFVTFQRNGEAVDFARLEELLELTIIPDDERGGITTSGLPTSAVAEDLRDVVAGEVIGLDPGANLHLRRLDSEQAESLALLPNGTVLIVNGRSPDDLWLQVTYQGTPGWVSSQYVELTFNGEVYDMIELPIIDTSTPTPTATATTDGGG